MNMRWTCWKCGRENREELAILVTCQCGEAYVLTMVPTSFLRVREVPRKPLEHGKLATYTSRGCRCDKCRAASNAYRRERRKAS